MITSLIDKKVKYIIALVVVLVISLVLFFTYSHFASQRKVTVDLKRENIVVTIDKVNEDKNESYEVMSLTESKTIKLKDGKYIFNIESEENSMKPVEKESRNVFIDGEDTVIEIKPKLSNKYLEKVLISNKESILRSIKKSYPKTLRKYKIIKQGVFGEGDWYGAILKRKDYKYQSDKYIIVAKKSGDSWQAFKPVLVLTKFNSPDISKEVAGDINKMLYQPNS